MNITAHHIANEIKEELNKDKFQFNFVPKTWSDIVDTCSADMYITEAFAKFNLTFEHELDNPMYKSIVELVNEWLADTYKARKKDYFWNYPKQQVNPLEAICGEF